MSNLKWFVECPHVNVHESDFFTLLLNGNIMTTILKDFKCATLINVFTVAPENQQKLVDLLIDATETSMSTIPGFLSANIHRSSDGTRVANYAQWRSVDDFKAMLKNPEATPHMQEAATIAESFDANIYEVIDVQTDS